MCSQLYLGKIIVVKVTYKTLKYFPFLSASMFIRPEPGEGGSSKSDSEELCCEEHEVRVHNISTSSSDNSAGQDNASS